MPPTTLLIDFDGTAAETNVGMALIETFARDASWRVIDDDYERGRFGSRMAYRLLGPLLGGDAETWRRYALEHHRLDSRLGELIDRARAAGWDVEILSDGLDVYIEALLGRGGIELPVRASRIEPAHGRGARIRTPHFNPRCGRCGTCKTERVESLARAGRRVVFLGDGQSDFCAAPRADRVFAKGVLAEHLREKNIAFEPFDTLGDVSSALFGPEKGE